MVGHHLLLAPAATVASTAAMAFGLVLVWLAQHAAGARALRPLALVIRHQTDDCMDVAKPRSGTWPNRDPQRRGGGSMPRRQHRFYAWRSGARLSAAGDPQRDARRRDVTAEPGPGRRDSSAPKCSRRARARTAHSRALL